MRRSGSISNSAIKRITLNGAARDEASQRGGKPFASAKVDLGPLSAYIGFHLRRAQDLSFQSFARRVGDDDLGPGHFAILVLIDRNPGLNQTMLSLATGRDKSTLTPALKALEGRKLIQRGRSQSDRRANVLTLTDAGRKRLRALTRHAEAHDRVLDSLVGEASKPVFVALLERIVEGLKRERDQQ